MNLKRKSSILLSLFLTGCSFYGGISMHTENADAPEFYAPNPIGILGLEKSYDRFKGFCEHRSSIPYREYGLGLNECGVKYYFTH